MFNFRNVGFVSLLMAVFFAISTSGYAAMNNGSLIQVPGSPSIYYLINGYAAHIPSVRVLECLRLKGKKIENISNDELNKLPKTAFLVKGSGNNIYRIDGESKRLVPNMQVFRRLGFNNDEIIHISDDMLNCIPKGPNLN
jgi:hypothetical protein